jgi:hypothetical protein
VRRCLPQLINYPEFRDGEYRALLELQNETRRTVRVLGLSAARILTDAHAMRTEICQTGHELLASQAVALQLL